MKTLQVLIAVLVVLVPLVVSAGNTEGRLAYRKGDYAAALKEFDAGGPIGGYFLAVMHLRGEGVPKDEARGIELLRKSADGGYPAAQYQLGQRYLYGLGLSRDRNRALVYLREAASDGDSRAKELLKIVEKGSRSEKKDSEAIVAAIKQKAMAKDPEAQYTLAFMYLVGDGVPKNVAEEIRWYRAASGKNARAAFMLSLMYQNGEGVPKKPSEAFRLMRFAAERELPRAQYYLGTFYYQGTGTPVDKQLAGYWFEKSAEKGFVEAQLAYGMLLLTGDGVTQDKSRAIEWLGKAAKQDNARAKEVLQELLTYRGQPDASLVAVAPSQSNSGIKRKDGQLRLEGAGVLLDQGNFGLKFSLPSLYDAYAPQSQAAARPRWENIQGGTFDIIIRPSR
jgi:TPR repeat protein